MIIHSRISVDVPFLFYYCARTDPQLLCKGHLVSDKAWRIVREAA